MVATITPAFLTVTAACPTSALWCGRYLPIHFAVSTFVDRRRLERFALAGRAVASAITSFGWLFMLFAPVVLVHPLCLHKDNQLLLTFKLIRVYFQNSFAHNLRGRTGAVCITLKVQSGGTNKKPKEIGSGVTTYYFVLRGK